MKNRTHKGPFLIAPHKRNGKLTGNWLVNIPATIAGSRTRKFFDNRIQAEQFAKNLERSYRRGELAQKPKTSKATMTFKEAVEKWNKLQLLRVETLKKKSISLATDTYRLKEALAVIGEEPLTKIDDEMLTEFQAKRLASGKSPATVNSDITAIKKVLNWAVKKEHIKAVPEVEKIPEGDHHVLLPNIEEVMILIDALPKRLKPLVRFIAETGCRSGEAFNLTWDCIDLEGATVQFKPKDGWTPKTKSSVRRVFLSGKLISILSELPKNGDYVFPGKISGKPIDNIKRAFATAVKEANITRNGELIRITPHTLRKAYATWQAIDNGVPESVLQSLLGHAPGSQVTAQYYVKPQQEAMQKAVLQLP